MIEIDITTRQVQAAIAQALERADDPEPLRRIGAAGVSLVMRGFSAGQAPDGTPWKPLKLRAGRPLRDTGRLMNSYNWQIEGGDTVRIGTNILYGLVHQYGATIHAQPGRPGTNFIGRRVGANFLHWSIGGTDYYAKSVTVPARPQLPLEGEFPPAWTELFMDVLQDWLRP